MEDITSVLTITEDTVESASETTGSSSVTSVTTLGDSPVTSVSENQLSSRTTDYDVVRATNALLVGAAAYRDPGFFAGRDGGKIKVSIGNDFYYDGSTLTVAGAISGGTIDIGGSDASSFHVDVDGNMWLGAATYAGAPMKISNAGAVTATTFTATNPSTVNVAGSVANLVSFTAGQAITSGMNVSVDSATGTIFRTRVSDLGTQNAIDVEPLVGSSLNGSHRFVNVSSTVKLLIFPTGNGSSQVTVIRFVVDPATSAITSSTETQITSAVTGGTYMDAVRISDTVCVIIYGSNAAADGYYAKVLSGLDTTVTQGTELQLVTGANSGAGCAIAPVSASEVVCFYYQNATEVRGHRVTLSGTTLTSSTTSTIYTSATDQVVHSAVQMGTASTYCVFFSESTTTLRGVAATYSGGSFTPGTAVTIQSFNVSDLYSESSSSSQGFIHYKRNSSRLLYVGTFSVSGTVFTANSPTNYATAANVSNSQISLLRLGSNTFAIGYIETATVRGELRLYEVVGTTVAQLGSTFVLTNRVNDNFPGLVYHSQTRLMVSEVYGSNCDSSTIDLTNNYSSWIGIANSSIASAASGYVVTHGASPATITTLATGSTYYTDIDGAFTTLTNGTRVGVAYSTTQLVVRS